MKFPFFVISPVSLTRCVLSLTGRGENFLLISSANNSHEAELPLTINGDFDYLPPSPTTELDLQEFRTSVIGRTTVHNHIVNVTVSL
jgi:hypothetical protein